MDATMTIDEVTLARRVIGLYGTATRARRTCMRRMPADVLPLARSLEAKGHAAVDGRIWRMTARGVDQLKLQIGEFSLPRAA